MTFYIYNLQTDFSHWRFRHLLWNCPNMNVTGLQWWSVDIGSGDGLVPSGNKPSPEPMLTQICCHMASLGHNELISKLISRIDILSISCEIAPRWFVNLKSWLVSIGFGNVLMPMTPNHNLNQCWPNSVMPYGVTRPQWIHSLVPGRCGSHFKSVISRHVSIHENFLWNCCQVNARKHLWW